MNTTNETDTSSLPMRAMKDIPQPNADAKQIVALIKSGGKVTGYKLSDGQAVDKQQGVQLAKQGYIKNVGVSSRNGSEYLKSLPDANEDNNLGNLPSVSE